MSRKEYFYNYLNGLLSQEEQKVVEAWVAGLLERVSSGAASEEEQFIAGHWLQHAAAPGHLLTKEAADQRKDGTFRAISTHYLGSKAATRKGRLHRLYRYAAVLILLFASGTVFYYLSRDGTAAVSFPRGDHYDAATVFYTVPSDSNTRSILLPDSSTVQLNSNSSLSIDTVLFNKKERAVWLNEGEAFFNIAKNPKKRFLVNFDNLQVIVIGTSFNIECYKDDHTRRVSVKTGIVAVKDQTGDIARLSPGNTLEYQTDSHRYQVQHVNTSDIANWINGDLIFNDATMDDIKILLQRYSHLTVTIKEQAIPKQGIKFNAVFKKGTKPETIAQTIAAIYDIRYKLDDNKLVFYR